MGTQPIQLSCLVVFCQYLQGDVATLNKVTVRSVTVRSQTHFFVFFYMYFLTNINYNIHVIKSLYFFWGEMLHCDYKSR